VNADVVAGPLERALDPLALATRCADRALLASSYDRRGGNHDWSNYLRVEGLEAVLMDAEGPGCLTRIWTADPQQGIVRIYLDGAPEPALRMPLRDLFARLPLSFGIGGECPENCARSRAERLPMGHTSYCPIPFARRCKVTIEPEDDYLYYQINYRRFPPQARIRTWDPDSPDPQTAELAALMNAISDPAWPEIPGSWSSVSLDAGADVEVLAAQGPGVVAMLAIRMPAISDPRLRAHVMDNLWLLGHFDDDELRDASVRAPIGPFFLDFGQERKPRTLFVGTKADGTLYCRFAMPFRQSARLRLVNRSIMPIGPIGVFVGHDSHVANQADLFRFRATWHLETPFGPDHRDYNGAACRILNLDGRDNYEILTVRGGGHFVGCGFHIDLRDAPTDRAAGEGDEMFFIDDDPALTHYGTGTEDYVNDAWGVRGYDGPLSGDAVSGDWGSDPQLFGYRLHLSDCIPFVRRARFTLEHGTGNNCSGLYRSVAYWYMDPANARTRVEERRWEEIRTGLRKPTSPIT
jgi:hypothetical protein